MSIFSKLFKLFLTVVLMPLIPMALLLTFYQGKVKDSILGTHANLAQIVASSINQHIEDLGWRLAFGQNLAEVLRAGKDPKPVLRTALTSNPDFLMLAVLDKNGKEISRVGEKSFLAKVPKLDLSQDEFLPMPDEKNLSVSGFEVVEGRPVSEFVTPLPGGNYLYGIMSFFGLLSRVQEQYIGRTGQIYIVGQDGQFFYGNNQVPLHIAPEQMQKLFAGKTRLIPSVRGPKEVFVGAFAPTPIWGTYAVVLQLKAEAFRGLYYTNIIILLFMLAIATLAYFGALTFAESLGEPISALDKAAREVSRGNLDQKVDENLGWGEFQTLIASFNKMTADLKDYQLLQVQAQLSEMKENVFRSVAHDLRAPLLGLQGYLYILSSGKASPQEEKEYLRLMDEAARNLSALLEDVLDVSRLEAGMLTPHLARVNLKDLARYAVDTLLPAAKEKGLEITTTVPDMWVQADEKLLRRVVVNLVSNAVKFTQQGFVRVEAQQTARETLLSVADSGIGLTPQEQQTVFQKYRQVHSDSRGYGLGLFISRQIVQAHGGTLTVSSRPGQGSVFTLALPNQEDK